MSTTAVEAKAKTRTPKTNTPEQLIRQAERKREMEAEATKIEARRAADAERTAARREIRPALTSAELMTAGVKANAATKELQAAMAEDMSALGKVGEIVKRSQAEKSYADKYDSWTAFLFAAVGTHQGDDGEDAPNPLYLSKVDKREIAVMLKREGKKSLREIAALLDCSHQSVKQWDADQAKAEAIEANGGEGEEGEGSDAGKPEVSAAELVERAVKATRKAIAAQAEAMPEASKGRTKAAAAMREAQIVEIADQVELLNQLAASLATKDAKAPKSLKTAA